MPTLEERIQKLEDEAAIRDLAAAFADAATRNDEAGLLAVWKKDGIFTIGAPLANASKGVEAILAFISKLRNDKKFFVQFVHSGAITVKGDQATAQWLVEEVAKGGDKYYRNYGFFSDAMEKSDGKWLFRERAFHYAYLDFSPFTGNAHVLPDPTTAMRCVTGRCVLS